jgi:hypothetical protein
VDTVTLPLIAETATVDAALATMRQRRRGAAVVDRGASLALVYERELLAARRQGRSVLSQVDSLTNLGQPAQGSNDPSTGLDARHPLAAVRGTNDTATLVARDDGALAGLVTPPAAGDYGAYCCDGPVTHYFPLPFVSAGDPCPRCVTPPGGITPTVHRIE